MVCTWKEIWNKRSFNFEILKTKDNNLIFQELKRTNSFDIINGGLTISELLKQYNQIKENFAQAFNDKIFNNIKSIYEVGCGSGANLYLFNKHGLNVGGIDYSKTLIDIAKQVLNSDDLTCDEAIALDSKKIYDVILSNSVFSYFPNFEYANVVLEKMYNKCKYAIGLIDIHDIEKKEDFISYRINTIENYKEKYKDLNKLFYSKNFFENFASKHNMIIKYMESDIEGYWNNEFIFNCFMYKNKR